MRLAEMKRERDKQQTSSAAVLAIGAELSRRGYDVTFTLGNTRRVDMLCSVPNGPLFKIQVKGISGEWGFYIDKSFFEGETQQNLFLVVVLVPPRSAMIHRSDFSYLITPRPSTNSPKCLSGNEMAVHNRTRDSTGVR
jgi:hypothetical protein